MSEGNYGGNGSVWWEVIHGPRNNSRQLKYRTTGSPSPIEDDDWIMTAKGITLGHDPTPLGEIEGDGLFTVRLRFTTRNTAAGGRQVSARSANGDDKPAARRKKTAVRDQDPNRKEIEREVAKTQLRRLIKDAQRALKEIETKDDVFVAAFVPLRDRGKKRPEENRDPWEVSIRWDESDSPSWRPPAGGARNV
jgi:hypothetical protein